MSWRKAVVLAFVLVLVGAIYLADRHRIRKERAQEAAGQRIFPWSAGHVQELTIERPSGTLRLAREEGGDWVLREPVESRADQEEVLALLARLLEAKKEREIEEAPEALEPYGLRRPRATIKMKALDTKGETVVQIGDKNPTGTFLYARVEGEAPVFLVYDTVLRDAGHEVFRLREKTLWDLHVDRVREIRISPRKGTDLVLERVSGKPHDWSITEPGRFKADGDRVEDLLSRLSRLNAVAFEDHPLSPLSDLGLDPPEGQISLRLMDPEEIKTLQVGVRVSDQERGDRLYARVKGADGVVMVDPKTLGGLDGAVEQWRDRTLIDFRTDAVVGLEIRRPDGDLVCRKAAEGRWEVEKPQRLEADALQVNDLLWTLQEERAQRFPAGHPPTVSWEKPAVQVALWLEGHADPVKIVLGGPTPDGQGFYAKVPAQDGVVVVSPRFWNHMMVSARDLRERRFMRFEASEIHRVQVIWEERTLDLIRDHNAWRSRPPEPVEVQALHVSDLLWYLKELRFEDEITPPPDPAALGEDHPMARITLWTARGEAMGPLIVGKAPSDQPKTRYVWFGGRAPVYLVKSEVLEDLKGKIEEILPKIFSGK